MYRAITLLLLTSFVLGCQSRSTPAGPSSQPPLASVIAGTAPQSMIGETVPWSCLVASLDQSVYGIFSSARVTCPSRAIRSLWSSAAAPASVPTSPLNLTFSVSGSTVALFWSAPTGSDPASSYIVEAGSATGRTDLANFDTGSPATTLTAPGVPPGTYFVRVRARNSAGVSAPSNETVLSVGGGGCGAAPNPPTSLSATSSGSTVTLVWTAPAGGCAPAAYVIEAGSSPGLSNLANFSTGNTSTVFTADGVGNGTYYVRVRATAAATSAPSNEAILIVGSPAVCVGAPTALVASRTGNAVTLMWEAPGTGVPSSYIVEVGRASGASDVGVTDTGNLLRMYSLTLAAGTYYFRVKAKSGCGTSAASNEPAVTIAVITNPPPTAAFTVIRNPDTVGLSGVTEGACAASQIGNSLVDLLRCTFDASASTPNPGITKYEWTIVSPAYKFSGQTVPAAQVPCGSFSGTASERTVTLTVTSPGGTSSATKQVTFVKAAAC